MEDLSSHKWSLQALHQLAGYVKSIQCDGNLLIPLHSLHYPHWPFPYIICHIGFSLSLSLSAFVTSLSSKRITIRRRKRCHKMNPILEYMPVLYLSCWRNTTGERNTQPTPYQSQLKYASFFIPSFLFLPLSPYDTFDHFDSTSKRTCLDGPTSKESKGSKGWMCAWCSPVCM